MNYAYVTVGWSDDLMAWVVNGYCDKVKRSYEIGLFDIYEEAERLAKIMLDSGATGEIRTYDRLERIGV